MFVSKVLSVVQTAREERRKKTLSLLLFLTEAESYRKVVEVLVGWDGPVVSSFCQDLRLLHME